jgi:hypothetical protein
VLVAAGVFAAVALVKRGAAPRLRGAEGSEL